MNGSGFEAQELGEGVPLGGVSAAEYADRLAVHYSSGRQDWQTPKELFAVLDREFAFTTDVAASEENALCPHFFTAETDGLRQDWQHLICYCNPPYNRAAEFLQKAAEEHERGAATIVLLIPARTDTSYWWKYALRATEIRFLPGRLRFGGAPNSAPFPSAVIVFDGETASGTPAVLWWNWKEAAK